MFRCFSFLSILVLTAVGALAAEHAVEPDANRQQMLQLIAEPLPAGALQNKPRFSTDPIISTSTWMEPRTFSFSTASASCCMRTCASRQPIYPSMSSIWAQCESVAPRARFELATLRLTAKVVKNLSAASGVAYIRLGAILTFLAAPNLAPKNIRNQPTTADALCPTTPFLDNFRVADHSGVRDDRA